jgi:hypothetical protein
MDAIGAVVIVCISTLSLIAFGLKVPVIVGCPVTVIGVCCVISIDVRLFRWRNSRIWAISSPVKS